MNRLGDVIRPILTGSANQRCDIDLIQQACRWVVEPCP
jgi:hypothetical protein